MTALAQRTVSRKPVPRGPAGVIGPIPDHVWDGPTLSFQNPDGSYESPVNLLGPEGPSGTAQNFDTRATLAASVLSAGVNVVRTNGYATVGDDGGATYVRAASEPSHAGKVQSFDGAWWELRSFYIFPEMLGAKADAATDDSTAINNSMTVAAVIGAQPRLSAKYYGVVTINVPASTRLVGAGVGQTTIYPLSPTATVFNFTGAGSSVEQLRIIFGGVTRVSSAVTFEIDQAGMTQVRHVTILLGGTNFHIGATQVAMQFMLDNITTSGTVVNGVEFDIVHSFIGCVSNAICSANPAARPFACFILRDASGQLQLMNNNSFQHTYGLTMIPATGQSIALVKSLLCYYDNAGALAWNLLPGAGATISHCISTMDWFNSVGGACVYADASAAGSSIDGIVFNDPHIFGGLGGFDFIKCSGMHINGGKIFGVTPGYAVVYEDVLNGSVIGVDAVSNAGGIYITGTTTRTRVLGNYARLNTAFQLLIDASGTNVSDNNIIT